MSIYDEIEEHMNAAMMVVDNHPLPAKFVDYMDHRIKALGRVEARAHDSRNLQLHMAGSKKTEPLATLG